jgi:uncharacterized damage-inducible protein DinB
MEKFSDVDLTGSEFAHVRLKDTRFDRVDLSGGAFRSVDLSDTDFVGTAFHRVRMRGVELCDVEISGEILRLTINGVDIGPLVEAELDRVDPERAKLLRPTDPDGFREAWAINEQRWERTVERARRLPAEVLHESVAGEWSFIETLRHLPFATDCWLSRTILGDPTPWHPLGLPWDEMPDTPGVPRDRSTRPSLDEALELRHERMGRVRRYLAELTDEGLAAETTPVEGPGWPEPHSYPVAECLLTVLNEEYHHRLFAERDLAVLEAEQGGTS